MGRVGKDDIGQLQLAVSFNKHLEGMVYQNIVDSRIAHQLFQRTDAEHLFVKLGFKPLPRLSVHITGVLFDAAADEWL